MSVLPRQAESLLSRLEWTVIRKLDGLLQGDYRTLFRGFGLDFADLREYQGYEDVRHIDWNVTARTQVTHVRIYNEDREVTAWFLLDLSPSVDFGSGDITKRQLLTEFVAVLARLLTRQGNRVGLILFNGLTDLVIPARTGRKHVLHIIDKVLTNPRLLRSPETDLGGFLRRSLAVIQRRSLIFVVSDFISKPGWERTMFSLNQRHEGLAIRLLDPLETALPDIGLLAFQDAETGEQILVDTNDRGFRRRFVAEAARSEEAMMEAFIAAGTDVLELSTGDDLMDAILRFANMRKTESRGGSAVPIDAVVPDEFSKRGDTMTFIWMDVLWLLLLIPLLIVAYIWLLRRKRKTSLRYANLALIKRALGKGPGWRRHIPPAILLLALAVLILAVARPVAVVTLASSRATVILAMDVSGSMRARDVDPSRIVASQAAAKQFIASQPATVQIGIVAFASAALLVQAPTIDREALYSAIDNFDLRRGTAVGSGILASLETVFPDQRFEVDGSDDPRDQLGQRSGNIINNNSRSLDDPNPPQEEHIPVEPGSYESAIVILLTDGATTTGPDPIAAGKLASEYGVRVFTVGFGSSEGDVVDFGGRSMRAQLDAPTLMAIAETTKAEYFEAKSSDDLAKVYDSLSTKLISEKKLTEIAFIFAGIGALLAMVAAGLSMLWLGRIA